MSDCRSKLVKGRWANSLEASNVSDLRSGLLIMPGDDINIVTARFTNGDQESGGAGFTELIPGSLQITRENSK